MKRLHVHLSVADLSASIHFYSGLFGTPPTVTREDYAKWMLDEPRVNFAISRRGNGVTGLNHLGFQADSDDELALVRQRFEVADAASTVAEPGARCCYALSDKHWVQDPQGIPWEAFHTLDSIPVWGAADEPSNAPATGECCASPAASKLLSTPVAPAAARCCAKASNAAPARACC